MNVIGFPAPNAVKATLRETNSLKVAFTNSFTNFVTNFVAD